MIPQAPAPFTTVLRFAREEAMRLRHSYIGTEHLLLGLLRCVDPEVTRSFDKAGTTAETVRRALEKTLPGGNVEEVASDAELPYTSRAKRVLELAAHGPPPDVESAPTCLLRGLLREERNIAAQVLRSLGVREVDE